MASTQQSAQEFLGNGRNLLTRSHLNCDPVIEALNQCKFFQTHELNSIESVENSQDKINIILDIVIAKGEEACYKFLKILDKKRFQVIPRPGLVLPDLHHWISCFSFQDEPQSQTANKADSDPCTTYQGLLRWKARQILDDKWNLSMNFLKNEQKRKPFTYIPLVMDTECSTVAKLKKNKGYKKSRSKKLKTYIPTDKKMLSPKDLLMNDEKSILLVGKPGVGKTTVALEILRLWTEEKSIPVSYVFYFDEPLMRVFSQSPYPQTLKDLLFQKYICPDEESDHVLENIESNSENVVLIFDGVMDVIVNSVIIQLMEKKLLKDAKILTTCRPEAEDTGYLSDWQSYRVEVQGFNHKSIYEYFKWMLGTTDDIGALKNPELFSLCSVPLYAFIVAACIFVSPAEARNKPFTVTEIYVRIFRFCMKQHGHQDVEHLDKYIKDNKRDIINLALASYKAMLAKTVNLTDLDHEDKSVQNAFLTKQFWNPSTTSCKVYAFLHNTMQEFWAALHIILNPDKITTLLDQCQSDEDGKYLKYIAPFLSGLLADNLFELIKCLVPVEQIKATRVKYFQQIIDTFLYTKEQNQEGDCEQFVEADNILFVCRCLYEYQSADACRIFLEKVQYELDLKDQTLDPYQCCVISYVVNQAVHRKIELDLIDCSITDPGLKLLLSSLKNLKFLRSTSMLKSQMWRVALEAGQFSDFDSLLSLFSFKMHLSALETLDQKVFQRIGEVLKNKRSAISVHLILHVNGEVITRSLQKAIFDSLPNIEVIGIFPHQFKVAIETELYLQGAIYEMKTGQRCVRNLLSVCSNNQRESFDEQCKFLLKLHELAKNMDVLPLLQPVFHALPPTWVVQPSNPSMSLLLQTMDVLNLKKPAELDHVTYELSELKIILQCMPYITQMRFSVALRQAKDLHKIVKIVVDLFILASESGGEKLKSLSTACSYSTFPFAEDSKDIQSFFLLDLFSQLKESSSKTALLALKPILQVAPAVWTFDLHKLEKTPALTELLKLQAVTKTLELTSWSCEREKLKNFLNCLPYISHLCCDEQFFQSVCEVLSADSEWNPKQIAELVRSLGFSISLIDMLPSRLCKAVASVFELLDKEEDISLSLLPQKISCQGCACLFSNMKKLQTLRVNETATTKLSRLVISDKEINTVTVEELSLVLSNSYLPERALCQLLGNLTSLLRVWTVHSLNLSEFKIEPHWLICLLCHQGPLSIKFHEGTLQRLAEIVYDAQDENLTQLFLEKIDGDLSPCNLSWEVLSYLIQGTKKQVTLDLAEGRFNVLNVPSLLAVLDTVCFKRISPRFVRAALKEIYQKRAGHLIVKLIKSSANLINLCMRELDSTDCKALCFALHYSDGVKLNLLNSVIPNNETGSIVKLLHRVSDLRVDRKLLLSFLHASKDLEKKGYSVSSLLTALNHKLDFSSNSSLGSGRFGQENGDLLTMSRTDFTAISSTIKTSTCDTELILYDCQADDSALEILFPILHKVHLYLGKSLLCQILTLIFNAPMAMSLQWASALSKALGKELDLSDTPLDYRTCESLQLVLDYKEELTHLNLSYCQITDGCLDLLLPHLHKMMILDLCDNQITEMGLLVKEARFETQQTDTRRCVQPQKYIAKDLRSKSEMEKSINTFVKTEDPIKKFEPELAVNNGRISYRFQWKTEGLFMCSATGLVFGLKGNGCVEYSVAHWKMHHLINTHYEPAGPLFDIKTPTGEIYELHLPHCETNVDAIGNLSVVHIHEDTREFLSPIKISRTHIAVNVCRLSELGIAHENNKNNKTINGQVLLFQEPDTSSTQQRLWVFLLPSNVPVSEIKEQQKEYMFIQTSSDCKLQINAKYALISKKAKRVQPKKKLFEPSHAGNHHPTFEIFLDKDVTELRIKIQCKIKESDVINFKTAWNRWIVLKKNTDNHAQMRSEEHSNIQVSCNNWISALGDIMEDLTSEEFKKLKHLMKHTGKRDPIRSVKLEKAKGRCELATLVVETWGFEESVKAIHEFMKKLPRNDESVTDKLKPYATQFGLIG
uniref:Uncharacterized protein n=1 Tax=Cyprinus carpio carpio TaxID=630221 RepID=A0A9J8AQH0_CYPCA